MEEHNTRSEQLLRELGRLPGGLARPAKRAIARRRADRPPQGLSRHLHLLLESTGEGVYGVDLHGRCTFINRAGAAMLGYSPEELIGQPMHDLVHARLLDGTPYPATECPIHRTVLTGEGVQLDDDVLWRQDGTSFPCDRSSYPIIEDGTILGAVIIFRDTTERRQAEELRSRQARQMALRVDVNAAASTAATLPEMLQGCAEALATHLDAAFARIWVLNEAEQMLELRASAGQYTHLDGAHSRVPVGALKIGRIAQSRRPHLSNAIAGDPAISDHDWARREGMVSFAGYPLLVEDCVVGVMGLFGRVPLAEETLDVLASVADTIAQGIKRGQAERELRSRHERLRLLSETASLLLMAECPDGLVKRVFHNLAEHLGLELYINYQLSDDGTYLCLDSFHGIPDHALPRLRRLAFGEAVCGSVAMARQPMVIEDVQGSNDPRVAIIRELGITAYACHPLLSRDRVIGTLSFGTRTRARFDADELALMQTVADQVAIALDRARLLRQEQAARATAEAATKLREEFLSIASHELKNPLTAVKGYIQLLRQRFGRSDFDPEQADVIAARVEEQVGRIEELIADLLDVSRIQQGRLDLRPEPMDLVDLARHVVDRFLYAPERGPSHVLLIDAPEPVEGVWDPRRLEQVLSNLVSNALKYTPEGGEVRAQVRSVDDEAELAVSDEGVGIPLEEQAELFKPFRRGTEAGEVSGSGLGLYITKQIVEHHGGTITVESAPGQGSTFTIRLPLARTMTEHPPHYAECSG